MISVAEWAEHNKHEKEWWGDCRNTSDEEGKHLEYAKYMGLVNEYAQERAFGARFNMQGRSVLDIGGGPVSLLLKCTNVKGTVLDPCTWPQWVMDRYQDAGIRYLESLAEFAELYEVFDEVWIYNTLQHTWRPDDVIAFAKTHGRLLRVFEWIDTEVTPGHPHVLTQAYLDEQFYGDNSRGVVDVGWPGYPPRAYTLVANTDIPSVVHLHPQPESEITVTITSTGRFDLLKRAVDSLLETIGCPVRIIISDDSCDAEQHALMLEEYSNGPCDLYIQDRKLGQAESLDFLYGLVQTPYIFHCEDDWEFIKTGYIEASLDILTEHKRTALIGLVMDAELEAAGAVGETRYRTQGSTCYYEHTRWRVDDKHDWWHGWIGSPHLMRKADYLELGEFQQAPSEAAFDRDVWDVAGMQSVWLNIQSVSYTHLTLPTTPYV